jgi:hypothetical protein
MSLMVFPWILIIFGNRVIKKDIPTLKETPDGEIDKERILKQNLERSVRRLNIIKRIFIFVAIFSTIIWSEDMFKMIHCTKAAMFIERSIEIVSPYISNQERLKLRAEFRAIEKADAFYRLEDKLRSIAIEQTIKLPEFESIR